MRKLAIFFLAAFALLAWVRAQQARQKDVFAQARKYVRNDVCGAENWECHVLTTAPMFDGCMEVNYHYSLMPSGGGIELEGFADCLSAHLDNTKITVIRANKKLPFVKN